MKYQEIYNEYKELLNCYAEKSMQVQGLPKGYITIRKIAGRDYHYLQCTINGKKKAECLREARVQEVRNGLVQREALESQLKAVEKDLARLEEAAKILDPQLSRMFYFLRQCSEMDALPVVKRIKALSFAKAMTALEGLPAKEETETYLQQWAAGVRKFADFYLPALEQYGILGGLK